MDHKYVLPALTKVISGFIFLISFSVYAAEKKVDDQYDPYGDYYYDEDDVFGQSSVYDNAYQEKPMTDEERSILQAYNDLSSAYYDYSEENNYSYDFGNKKFNLRVNIRKILEEKKDALMQSQQGVNCALYVIINNDNGDFDDLLLQFLTYRTSSTNFYFS